MEKMPRSKFNTFPLEKKILKGEPKNLYPSVFMMLFSLNDDIFTKISDFMYTACHLEDEIENKENHDELMVILNDMGKKLQTVIDKHYSKVSSLNRKTKSTKQ